MSKPIIITVLAVAVGWTLLLAETRSAYVPLSREREALPPCSIISDGNQPVMGYYAVRSQSEVALLSGLIGLHTGTEPHLAYAAELVTFRSGAASVRLYGPEGCASVYMTPGQWRSVGAAMSQALGR